MRKLVDTVRVLDARTLRGLHPILVLIPTYNERENVEAIRGAIRALDIDLDVLFVDDGSPDGTGAILDRMACDDAKLTVIHRREKLGIGSAHLQGIAWAYARSYRTLITMDGDFSHQVEDVPRFLAEADAYDVVVGSRYLMRESLQEWNPFRRALTSVEHLMTRHMLGLRYDATGAYRLYRLDRIPKDAFEAVRATGYSFFFESMHVLQPVSKEYARAPAARAPGETDMPLFEIDHDQYGGHTHVSFTSLTNASGATRTAGDVVVQNTASATSFTTTTTAGDTRPVFVVVDTSITASAAGYVARYGIATVNVQGNVALGNYLRTSTTAGRAADAGGSAVSGVFGRALTSFTGTSGTVVALLFGITVAPLASFTGLSSIQFIRKTTNETVNNSGTLQNDDELFAALAANEVVMFQCCLVQNSNSTADFLFTFTVPSGATVVWNFTNGLRIGAGGNVDTHTAVTASGTEVSFEGFGADQTIFVTGVVTNGGNSGNLQLQWAQNTPNASNTTVKANSFLLVYRV